MKSFYSFFAALAFVLCTLGLSAPFARADNNGAQFATAQWIVEHTKTLVRLPQASKIVNAVFDSAQRFQIDPFLILAMIQAESRFQPRARNAYGARGLMQVVPRYHRDKIKGRNIEDIATNVDVGVQVFQECLERYGDGTLKSLRCYSGGASKAYRIRIMKTRRELQEAVLAWNMKNDQPLVAMTHFDKPREYYAEQNRQEILKASYHPLEMIRQDWWDALQSYRLLNPSAVIADNTL